MAKGGAYLFDADVFLSNCTFSGNISETGAGGIDIHLYMGAACYMKNCVMWGDSLPELRSDDPTWFSIWYSDIEGCGGSGAGWNSSFGNDNGGNIDADPLFVDGDGADDIYGTEDDDHRLQPGSPCIDAGGFGVPADYADLDGDGDTTEPTPYDLFGNDRRVDDPATVDSGAGSPPIVDMGAYEYQP